jgi:hypothetical protein
MRLASDACSVLVECRWIADQQAYDLRAGTVCANGIYC